MSAVAAEAAREALDLDAAERWLYTTGELFHLKPNRHLRDVFFDHVCILLAASSKPYRWEVLFAYLFHHVVTTLEYALAFHDPPPNLANAVDKSDVIESLAVAKTDPAEIVRAMNKLLDISGGQPWDRLPGCAQAWLARRLCFCEKVTDAFCFRAYFMLQMLPYVEAALKEANRWNTRRLKRERDASFPDEDGPSMDGDAAHAQQMAVRGRRFKEEALAAYNRLTHRQFGSHASIQALMALGSIANPSSPAMPQQMPPSMQPSGTGAASTSSTGQFQVLIENLPSSTTEAAIRERLSRFGDLRYVAIHPDPAGRGCIAEVQFFSVPAAGRAVACLNGETVAGQQLRVVVSGPQHIVAKVLEVGAKAKGEGAKANTEAAKVKPQPPEAPTIHQQKPSEPKATVPTPPRVQSNAQAQAKESMPVTNLATEFRRAGIDIRLFRRDHLRQLESLPLDVARKCLVQYALLDAGKDGSPDVLLAQALAWVCGPAKGPPPPAPKAPAPKTPAPKAPAPKAPAPKALAPKAPPPPKPKATPLPPKPMPPSAAPPPPADRPAKQRPRRDPADDYADWSEQTKGASIVDVYHHLGRLDKRHLSAGVVRVLSSLPMALPRTAMEWLGATVTRRSRDRH